MKAKYPKEHSKFFSIQTTTPALLEQMNSQFIFKKKKSKFLIFFNGSWSLTGAVIKKQTRPKNLLPYLLISWLSLN